MTERLRVLERALAADPSDLVALRALADERKRRGLEMLPAAWHPERGVSVYASVMAQIEAMEALHMAIWREWARRHGIEPRRVQWRAPRREWIDPLHEARAHQTAIAAGIPLEIPPSLVGIYAT